MNLIFYYLLSKLQSQILSYIVFPRFGEIKISQNVFKKAGFNVLSVSKEIELPIKYEIEGGRLQREIYVLN